MIISTVRCYPNESSTGGVLLVDGDKFCESQEDCARAYGYKVEKKTCIPAGSYQVDIRNSHRFGRDMLVLYNEKPKDDLYIVRNGGVMFTYIYAHGGNTADNSEGCILVAFNRLDRDTIQGTAEKPLFNTVRAALSAGEHVVWQVIDDPENVYNCAESKYL